MLRSPFLILVLAAAPACADPEICAEYWYARNAIFNAAGHCFSSPLGLAEFDNSDCVPGPAALTAEQTEQVALIRRYEAAFACAVDTNQSAIRFSDKPILQRLLDMPVRGFDGDDSDPIALEFTTSCMGWLGAGPEVLRAGASADLPVVGAVQPGDSLNYSHHDLNGWSYVTVTNRAEPMGGWTRLSITDVQCEAYAG